MWKDKAAKDEHKLRYNFARLFYILGKEEVPTEFENIKYKIITEEGTYTEK